MSRLYDDFALWRGKPSKILRNDMSWGWHFLQQSHLGFTELTMMGQIFGPALIINSFAFTPQLTIAEQMTGDVTRVSCTRLFVNRDDNYLKNLIS